MNKKFYNLGARANVMVALVLLCACRISSRLATSLIMNFYSIVKNKK